MKKSIFFKTFSGYFLIIFLLSFLFLVFSFHTIRKHYLENLSNNLKNISVALTPDVKRFVNIGDASGLDRFVKDTGENLGVRITFVDTKGVVLADSEEDPADMENHSNRPEILSAYDTGFGTSLRFSDTVKEEMLYAAVIIKSGDKDLGALRTSLFLREINELLGSLRIRMAQSVFAITVLSVILALLISRAITRPLKRLVAASNRIAQGDFDARITVTNNDELAELAYSFNNMANKIKGLFNELAVQKEELASIIASIPEGLLIVDREGKVVFANEMFKEIIGAHDIEGRFYVEVLRKPALVDCVNNVSRTKDDSTDEFDIGPKSFVCTTSYLKAKEEIVLTLHDITEMKKLAQIKKDFVVNVSHELRTPLTAIKGFVETLEEEVDENNRHYVEIIQRHTERLINIVKDLLLLSEMEENQFKLEVGDVGVTELLEEVLKIFYPKAKEKNIELNLINKTDSDMIKGDHFKLEQLFINLIDNAIKYTVKGSVGIELENEGKMLTVKIKDSGIGIPQEDITRIFERFYVVDKSRSKKLGGTGLGLAIVKHIVFLHNGRIDVKSVLGEGTVFTVNLPLKA